MIKSPALLVVLFVLATARLTTLVNDDYLTEPIRAWVDSRAAARVTPMQRDRGRAWSYLAYLLGCPWCVSIWIGLPLAGVTYAWHAYWPVQVLLLGLTASHVTGLLAVIRDRIEGE